MKVNGNEGGGKRDWPLGTEAAEEKRQDRQKKGEMGGGQGPLKRKRRCTGGALSSAAEDGAVRTPRAGQYVPEY